MVIEDSEFDFREILIKILDGLSETDCKKLKFLLGKDITRQIQDDPSIDGTLNLFQRLFDQQKISDQNFTYLIKAFEAVQCPAAAQRLRDHQMFRLRTRSVNSTGSVNQSVTVTELILADEYFTDFQLDKQPSSALIQCHSDQQLQPLVNNNKILLSDPTSSSRRLCEPSPYERYFIKSKYSGKLIGVVNKTSDQGEKLLQWYDDQKQRCIQQWYFIPVPNRKNHHQFYIIQSVFNRKVFDVPGGAPSNENSIQQWDIAIYNPNQQFRLIDVPKEKSCLIQNVASEKVLDGITKQSITQAQLDTTKIQSTIDNHQTLWQIIPFNGDRPGEKLTDCPYVSSLNDLTVIKFGQVFGDDGGYSTDDSQKYELSISHYISSIFVVWSDWLNSMTMTYSSSNPQNNEQSRQGYPRGQPDVNGKHKKSETFNVTVLDLNERISRVHLIIGIGQDMQKAYRYPDPTHYIVGIQFHTTHNRSSQYYGSQQGQLFIEEYPGFALGYVRGGSNVFIERLQFVWYKI
ncbi:unnamed protein product [Rotaria sordida]|uniref:DED domain-containing protein n=1 Tax=Rotaria sordida TaxID=392033 RepID=A0A814RXF4_9BILA|nr:unnamed protein product [Rotaria sordida]